MVDPATFIGDIFDGGRGGGGRRKLGGGVEVGEVGRRTRIGGVEIGGRRMRVS